MYIPPPQRIFLSRFNIPIPHAPPYRCTQPTPIEHIFPLSSTLQPLSCLTTLTIFPTHTNPTIVPTFLQARTPHNTQNLLSPTHHHSSSQVCPFIPTLSNLSPSTTLTPSRLSTPPLTPRMHTPLMRLCISLKESPYPHKFAYTIIGLFIKSNSSITKGDIDCRKTS